jgi:RNA polymerase sigma-70 factor (sigma-E family)
VEGTSCTDRVPAAGVVTERALDADALVTALFDMHYPRLLRVAAVLLGDVGAAEDVVQDAFLGLHAAWDGVRDRGDAAGYLHRSVVNGARSRRRRQAVALRNRPSPPPDVASAEDAALAGLLTGPLVAALRAMPRREREAVLLRHYLDLSEAQTAEALGLRRGSVKAYASRGLARLRAVLDTAARPEGDAR